VSYQLKALNTSLLIREARSIIRCSISPKTVSVWYALKSDFQETWKGIKMWWGGFGGSKCSKILKTLTNAMSETKIKRDLETSALSKFWEKKAAKLDLQSKVLDLFPRKHPDTCYSDLQKIQKDLSETSDSFRRIAQRAKIGEKVADVVSQTVKTQLATYIALEHSRTQQVGI